MLRRSRKSNRETIESEFRTQRNPIESQILPGLVLDIGQPPDLGHGWLLYIHCNSNLSLRFSGCSTEFAEAFDLAPQFVRPCF